MQHNIYATMLIYQDCVQCILVRAAGIEPAANAWEALILPLNYARKANP